MMLEYSFSPAGWKTFCRGQIARFLVEVACDIAVWGGPARLAFHGLAPLADGEHALLGRQRVNLTFRKVL
jgi:hypothetical protein